MPLTKEEMKKLTSALFYAEGMSLVNGNWMISKFDVFKILNDYSPDMDVELKGKGSKYVLNYTVKNDI